MMNVLLIEDDPLVLRALQKAIPQNSYVETANSLVDFFRKPSKVDSWDLALVDLMSELDPQGEKSIELIQVFRKKFPLAAIIVQSGVGEIEVMRQVVRQGANRFVLKENILEQLPLIFEWVKELRSHRDRVESLMIGKSLAMTKFKEKLLRAMPESDDILIEGESGVGKELCALAFTREGRPFVSVNVASIPSDIFEGELFGYERGAFSGAQSAKAGLLEAAEDGILFLDEIQSLKYDLQVKLLRVLENRTFRRLGSNQEKQFKGRILSASNRPLASLVADSSFREDLFFRLSAISINIPPLRMRGGDVTLLAQNFLSEFDLHSEKSFEDDALKMLEAYDWPGNVRQLKMCVKNAVMNASIPKIGQQELEVFFERWESVSLAPSISQGNFTVDWNEGLDANVAKLERYIISKVIERDGSVKARETLKIKKSRFYEKVKTLGISAQESSE